LLHNFVVVCFIM